MSVLRCGNVPRGRVKFTGCLFRSKLSFYKPFERRKGLCFSLFLRRLCRLSVLDNRFKNKLKDPQIPVWLIWNFPSFLLLCFFLSVSYREADLERSPSRILDKRVLYPLHGEYLKMCFRASVGWEKCMCRAGNKRDSFFLFFFLRSIWLYKVGLTSSSNSG